MIHLLDVNLIYALHLSPHVHYASSQKWFDNQKNNRLATCSITQCGLLRMLMMKNDGQISDIEEARKILDRFTNQPNHVYFAESPQVMELIQPIAHRLQGHRQITDAYLLALAAHHNAKLATLDKGIVHLAGREFAHHLELIS